MASCSHPRRFCDPPCAATVMHAAPLLGTDSQPPCATSHKSTSQLACNVSHGGGGHTGGCFILARQRRRWILSERVGGEPQQSGARRRCVCIAVGGTLRWSLCPRLNSRAPVLLNSLLLDLSDLIHPTCPRLCDTSSGSLIRAQATARSFAGHEDDTQQEADNLVGEDGADMQQDTPTNICVCKCRWLRGVGFRLVVISGPSGCLRMVELNSRRKLPALCASCVCSLALLPSAAVLTAKIAP